MKNKTQTRTEIDSLGSVKVPKNAYHGAFTARAKQNFKISDIRSPKIFEKALGLVKLATTNANYELKLLTKEQFNAIEVSCKEFIEGKFSNEFDLDIFQSGAGTAYNMNANEIIANRANELLKAAKGTYKFIHPNNHINLSQSSNDVIPTVTKIAILLSLPTLINAIKKLEKEFNEKANKYRNIAKIGRTHLQDAVPITFGQEFESYAEAITKSRKFIEQQSENLKIIGLGGTAVGTGINTDKKYKNLVTKLLSKLTEIKFSSAKNLTEMANNMTSFVNLSSALKSLAINLLNISSDLKIMASGPIGGLNEITLPEVQPGSSIMPGKVNPSIIESLEMVCISVLGACHTIELAAQKSHFELNVFCPTIMYNTLESMRIFTNGISIFTNLCLKDLKVNIEKVKKNLDKSLSSATALVPHLGYELAAQIVKSSLRNNRSIKKEVLSRKLIDKKTLDEILSIERIADTQI